MRTTPAPSLPTTLSLDDLAQVSGGCKKKCPPPPPPPQPEPQGGTSVSTDVSVSYQ